MGSKLLVGGWVGLGGRILSLVAWHGVIGLGIFVGIGPDMNSLYRISQSLASVVSFSTFMSLTIY